MAKLMDEVQNALRVQGYAYKREYPPDSGVDGTQEIGNDDDLYARGRGVGGKISTGSEFGHSVYTACAGRIIS